MEDDEGLLYLLRNALEADNFEVTGVPNGEQGLELLQQGHFDVVVIDQEMPVMTGLEIILHIQTLKWIPPIIMVTGNGNEEIAVQAMRTGASDYLVKDTSLHYLELLPTKIRRVVHERELTEARQAAELALQLERDRSRLLTQFIQDASHEFRTPLAIINTSSELLSRISDQPKQTVYIQRIQDQANKILSLVSDLIRLAQLDSMVSVLSKPIVLNTLMHQVLDQYMKLIQERALQLTLRLPEVNIRILGDAYELNEALGALIDNACHYSQSGASLEIILDQKDKAAVITIRDTGIGISEQEIAHIFERFYRVDKAHSTTGFGLGLCIAARIIELHQGEIHVESQYGLGTQVTVTLPLNLA
ncbi:MAG: hybrid sensor histidine kinase/response regulator [Chloroflexota bacterium]